jgi:hypothetical protein
MTAGELNKCRQIEMDSAMMKKMGVGHVYRYTSVDEKTAGQTRYMLKLWWAPKVGWHTKNPPRKGIRTSAVFDVPENVFLKWIQPDLTEA